MKILLLGMLTISVINTPVFAGEFLCFAKGYCDIGYAPVPIVQGAKNKYLKKAKDLSISKAFRECQDMTNSDPVVFNLKLLKCNWIK